MPERPDLNREDSKARLRGVATPDTSTWESRIALGADSAVLHAQQSYRELFEEKFGRPAKAEKQGTGNQEGKDEELPAGTLSETAVPSAREYFFPRPGIVLPSLTKEQLKALIAQQWTGATGEYEVRDLETSGGTAVIHLPTGMAQVFSRHGHLMSQVSGTTIEHQPQLSPHGGRSITQFTYDPSGRLATESHYFRLPYGKMVTCSDIVFDYQTKVAAVNTLDAAGERRHQEISFDKLKDGDIPSELKYGGPFLVWTRGMACLRQDLINIQKGVNDIRSQLEATEQEGGSSSQGQETCNRCSGLVDKAEQYLQTSFDPLLSCLGEDHQLVMASNALRTLLQEARGKLAAVPSDPREGATSLQEMNATLLSGREAFSQAIVQYWQEITERLEIKAPMLFAE